MGRVNLRSKVSFNIEMNRSQFSGACRRIPGEPVLLDAQPADKAPNDLHVFSIPYGLTVYKQPLPDQIGHFVTTNSNNDRSYGTFISYTSEVGTNRYAVNSICVISEHPLFEISKNLLLFLKFFTNQTASGKKDMKELYINAYINIIELDKQNDVEIIHYPISSPYRDQVFIHYSSCLPNYEYGLLFEAFSAESIIDLFCCLLLEQKILMVTHSTQFLCPIAETLISLLSPLTWHHVYVPYLSSAITDYLDVPVPFFMGISRSEQVKKDCIVADIDAGKLIIPEGVEIPTPPVPYTTRLFKDLKDIMGSSEQRQKKYLKVKNAFSFFFVEIFRDIVDFIRGTGFDNEGFLETQTKENRQFMELLIKTEAFNQFIYNKNSSAFADFMKQISDIKRTDSFIYRS